MVNIYMIKLEWQCQYIKSYAVRYDLYWASWDFIQTNGQGWTDNIEEAEHFTSFKIINDDFVYDNDEHISKIVGAKISEDGVIELETEEIFFWF